MMQINWEPFIVCPLREFPPYPRSIQTKEGRGDRLRAAAFAEVQARDAFRWAAEKFQDAPETLREAWLKLAKEEQKHLDWLLKRMKELEIAVDERPVSAMLWESFIRCQTAREFSEYMANAEERGRKAGERFLQVMEKDDPETARIFGQIALEERGHIELARRYFPRDPILLSP